MESLDYMTIYLLQETGSGRLCIRSVVEDGNDKPPTAYPVPTHPASLHTQAVGGESHRVKAAAGKGEPSG